MSSRPIIVIVDDDSDDREMVRGAFIEFGTQADFHLLDTGDGLLEYLQQPDSPKPALILLDLNMPGKDGRETLREQKSNKDIISIPTIVFTTSSSERDKQICYSLGANVFITKPDTFEKLVDIAGCVTRLWLT